MTRNALRWLPVVLSAVAAPAYADVVEPGFVETCTLANVREEHPGEVCIECSTYYAEARRCDDQLREGGYTQVCRSGGASVWTQIGCRGGTAPPATTEPAPPATATPPATTEPAPTPPATTEPAPTPPATTEPAPTPPATSTPEPAASGCAASPGASSRPTLALALGAALLVIRRRRARA